MRGSALLLGLLASSPAWARPVVLPLQGQLTDAAGTPIDGVTGITFRLYGDPTPTLPMHEERLSVELLTGDFTVYLGSSELLDSSLFNLDQDVWLGIQIDGDVEMELIRVGWTPLASFAAHAGDAETLDGYGSADFLASSWRPQWADIAGRPPGLDDGDDVGSGGTSWTIGAGLVQTGAELSVDPLTIYGWAEQVCYDSVTELRGSLDSVYLSATWRPAWSDVTDKPPGFADNTDDDTRYSAGDGLQLTDTTFSADWPAVDVRIRQIAYDTEAELHTALDDEYKPATYTPTWSELTGVPAGFADGTDDGGPSYVAGAGIEITGNVIAAAPAAIDTPAEVVAAADPTFIDEDELNSALAPYATEDEVDAAVAAAGANDARVDALEAQLQAALAAIDALTDRVEATEITNVTLTNRVAATEAANAALEDRVEASESANATLQTRVAAVEGANAALEATNSSLSTRLAALESTWTELLADYDELAARVTTIEETAVWYIGEDVTYDIPGDFASLHEAFSWLGRYRISPDALVTLQVAPGTYTFTETLAVGHPDANNIEIVGNTVTPTSVVLEAAPGSAAEAGIISVGRGIYLGAVRGMTLASTNTASGNALLAWDNGGIGVADNVRVEGFLYGAQATSGGTLIAPGIVTDGSGSGLLSNLGGYMRADDARIVMEDADSGVGLYSASGSVLVALGARTTNGQYGSHAVRNALIYADDAIFTSPGTFGAYSLYGSHMRLDSSTVNGTMTAATTYGFLAQYDSSILANTSTLSATTTWGYRSTYNSTIAASYAIANRVDGYNVFASEYASSMYAPYSSARTTHFGYYGNASAMNLLNASSTGGDYGFYAHGNTYMEASDSVSSGAGNFGFYSIYSSYLDRTGSAGTTSPAAAATNGVNSNNYFSFLR